MGGAARAESRRRAGSVHVRGRREENRICVREKPLLELHVCSIRGYYTQKQSEGKEETQSAAQGGRFSFDLDSSVHSLHGERFKGRVLLWLASAG